MKALFDSNIVIDYLSGVEAAKAEFNRYENPMISIVTWMEVMVGASPGEEPYIRTFLSRFQLLAIDEAVAERTVLLRRKRRLRLPDAIIWASALCHDALLISRNSKDFPPDEPGVRMPYSV